MEFTVGVEVKGQGTEEVKGYWEELSYVTGVNKDRAVAEMEDRIAEHLESADDESRDADLEMVVYQLPYGVPAGVEIERIMVTG